MARNVATNYIPFNTDEAIALGVEVEERPHHGSTCRIGSVCHLTKNFVYFVCDDGIIKKKKRSNV